MFEQSDAGCSRSFCFWWNPSVYLQSLQGFVLCFLLELFTVSYLCCGMLFQLLHGVAGLLITNMPKEEVERYLISWTPSCLELYHVSLLQLFTKLLRCSLFNAYENSDFSRTRSTAVETVCDYISHSIHYFECNLDESLCRYGGGALRLCSLWRRKASFAKIFSYFGK